MKISSKKRKNNKSYIKKVSNSKLANNKLAIIMIVLTIAAGAILVSYSMAATTQANQLVLMYDNTAMSHVIEKVSADGTAVKTTNQPFEFLATAQGDLYCKGSDNEMHKSSIGAGAMKNLTQTSVNDLKAVKAQETSSLTVNTPGQSLFVSDGTNYASATIDPSKTGNKFNALVNRIKIKCQASATTVAPDKMPEFNLPKVDSSNGTIAKQPLSTPFGVVAHAATIIRDTYAEDVQYYMINLTRSNYKVKPALIRKTCVDKVAVQWTLWMATLKTIFHNPNLGVQGNKIVDSCGYKAWFSVGENVGFGPTSLDIFNSYMHSPDHKANILNTKWLEVGVGGYINEGLLYNTQDFIKPLYY